jgi:hypothetical protein
MEVSFSASAFRCGYAEQDFYGLLATKYFKIRSQRGLDDVYVDPAPPGEADFKFRHFPLPIQNRNGSLFCLFLPHPLKGHAPIQ